MGSGASAAESPASSRQAAVGSGRGGPVRSALRKSLEEARRKSSWTAAHEVRALLALRYADLVDRAARADDGAGLLRAGDKLLELMGTLGIASTPGKGVTPGDGDGNSRGPDETERLHLVIDSPPQVGDTANP